MSGIVYVLSHKAIPDLLKIGYTTRSIEERVQELSSTGVPGKYTVELYFQTEDAPQFESLLHRTLREFHFEKEFFRADIKTVIRAIHGLISENRFQLYKFHGVSSHLATTKEQIAEERRIRDERQNRIDEKAKELRDKYLHKTYDELRGQYKWLAGDSTASHYEIKELQKMMRLKSDEEKKERDIQAQKNLLIFEDKFADPLKNLGLKVHSLLKRTAKQKFLLSIRGYSFKDGENLSKTLKQDEKELVLNFYKIFEVVSGMFAISIAYHYIGIPETEQSLIVKYREEEFSEYFKGILTALKNS
jgi:T5orf172 domain